MRKPTRKQCLDLLPDEKKVTVIISEETERLCRAYAGTRPWREILDQVVNHAIQKQLRSPVGEPGEKSATTTLEGWETLGGA